MSTVSSLEESRLAWVAHIPDPVWGEIPITEVEQKIINTREFNRLRGIKQLGFSYVSFPGASHTRFEHSLGTMHVADTMLKMIDPRSIEGTQGLPKDIRQELRLTALLHDIGHSPFSHPIERLSTRFSNKFVSQINKSYIRSLSEDYKIYKEELENLGENSIHSIHRELMSHEFHTRCIIENERTSIYNVLKKHFQGRDIPALLKAISSTAIGKDINGKIKESIRPDEYVWFSIFKSIMNGDIDADKIDYLMRDNYYCGIPFKLDIFALRNSIKIIWKDRAGNIKGINFKKEVLPFINSLMLARYNLITKVHYDSKTTFIENKAVRAIKKYLLEKNEKMIEEIIKMHTEWEDPDFINYCGDEFKKDVLWEEPPQKQIGELSFDESHPSIRGCIDVLSRPENHPKIQKIEEDLNNEFGREDLIVDIYGMKLLGFATRVDGGMLSDNLIARGIMGQSYKTYGIVVFGTTEGLAENTTNELIKEKPCFEDNCPQKGVCVKCLGRGKQLLAGCVVEKYREVAGEYGNIGIFPIGDFLCSLLGGIDEAIKESNKDMMYPTREQISRIINEVILKAYGKTDPSELLGENFKKEVFDNSLRNELRRNVYIGLIDAERRVEVGEGYFKLFEHRYKLSEFGEFHLQKLKLILEKGETPFFKEPFRKYVEELDSLKEKVIEKKEEVVGMLDDLKKYREERYKIKGSSPI